MSNGSLIKVGIISSPHGTAGLVKISSSTANADDLLQYPQLMDKSCRKRFTLTAHGYKEHKLIGQLSGVHTRNDAEKLRGTELYAIISNDSIDTIIDEDPLLRCTAVTQDGTPYGTIIEIDNFGADDVITIKRTDGEEEMLPFNEQFFADFDEKNKRITVMPPSYIEADSDEAAHEDED